MANLPKDWPIEEYKDVMSQEFWLEELELRKKKQGTDNPDMSGVWDGLQRKARDHARNPAPHWDDSENAGFSLRPDSQKPWMRVHDDYKEWNVAKQQKDPHSVLSFWKAMLVFRKKHLSCTYGIYTPFSESDEQVFVYTKEYKSERIVVAMNFTKEEVEYGLPDEVGPLDHVVDQICNIPNGKPTIEGRSFKLRPYEAVVLVCLAQRVT